MPKSKNQMGTFDGSPRAPRGWLCDGWRDVRPNCIDANATPSGCSSMRSAVCKRLHGCQPLWSPTTRAWSRSPCPAPRTQKPRPKQARTTTTAPSYRHSSSGRRNSPKERPSLKQRTRRNLGLLGGCGSEQPFWEEAAQRTGGSRGRKDGYLSKSSSTESTGSHHKHC